MTAPSHQSLYRDLPLVVVGLLGSLLLLVAGIAGILPIAAREQRLSLALGMLAAFVAAFVVCALTAMRRHRWTIEADAVSIEERPLVPLFGRRRMRRVPFTDIAALNNVSGGAEELLALTNRDGDRFVLAPVRTAAKSDSEGLAAFAARLQAAMAAAGVAAPRLTDGLGFWNRPVGLALQTAVLAASLVLTAVVLWGLWEGAYRRVKTHDAAALVALLPILLGGMLYRSWQRRRAVLRAMR
jgi:hypothetical protein